MRLSCLQDAAIAQVGVTVHPVSMQARTSVERGASVSQPIEATARHLAHWEVEEERGPAVAIDVIRAFTTAAYAFAAGARAIYLVEQVEEALAFKRRHPEALAMGEERGLMPDGFDFSNSPVRIAEATIAGRTLVQRTSAGTRGALAAAHARRLWCASLVCASATARALARSELGAPVYVITGRSRDGKRDGADDLAVAEYIEQVRRGQPADADEVARRVLDSQEASLTLRLGAGHVHPDDIRYAARVDAFSFAMEAKRDADGLYLVRVDVP